jgi:uncharacterized membrane protein YfcA
MNIYQLAVMIVLFFATIIASTFGFGLGLIAIPILASFTEVSIATPLSALAALTVIVLILLKKWREMNFQGVWQLILASCIGTPFGLIFLKSSQDNLLKVILAITIMLFSGYLILQPNIVHFKTDRWAWLFGAMAGFLGGAFALPAPPVLLYGIFRRWQPSSFRTTLLGFFLPSSLIVAVSHWIGGFWTSSVLILYGLSFPVILLGIVIGNYLNRIIPKQKFTKLIYGLLFLCGLILFIQTLYILFTNP